MALTWREREAFEQIVDRLRAEDPTLGLGVHDRRRPRWARRGRAALCAELLLVLLAGCGYLFARHRLSAGRGLRNVVVGELGDRAARGASGHDC